ncbi:hypothetical protein R1sor_002801 [Riccia sorocarpa]|uniref:Uncharacterized protein n=1 Tax=Riccia sorocarpa TaxID=122646 RepID=A0ABD3H2J7_9MARC
MPASPAGRREWITRFTCGLIVLADIVGMLLESFVSDMYTRVREGNDYRVNLEGMFFKPNTFGWFRFPRGIVVEIPTVEEDESHSPRGYHRLTRGYFYLPETFDLSSDFIILHGDLRRTRLKGLISMPPGVQYTIIPEEKILYKVDNPFPGEDFSCSFLTYEDLQFPFPAGSSLFIADVV